MMRLYQQLYIAQPQTNTGQRTVGKITAPIELIEYTVLFGNRNADTIIRHPYHQLVILQKTIYNNMHRLARILHGVFYQITDNIGNMHRVCRYQSLRTEMGFNSNILILRYMVKPGKLFQTRLYIKCTDGKLRVFIIGTRHIT